MSGKTDQSPFHTPPNSTLLVRPPPPQFPPGAQYTPFRDFPAQYAVPAHPPLSQNHLSQPLAYHAYRLLEPSPYPSIGHLPLSHQPQAYVPRQSNVLVGNPSYQQAQQPLPPPLLQFTTGSPGSSHAGTFGGTHQYVPHPYSVAGHLGSPQPYPPGVYQWYHSPSSSVDTFIEGDQMQAQQRYPMNYPYPQTQLPRRGSHTVMARSTPSETSSLPALMPSGNSVAHSAPRNTTSPTTNNPPNDIPTQNSPKTATQKPAPGNIRTHEHPTIRRHYHPNPPPKRSEWVMWIGNVPRDATHDELGLFLNQPTTVSSGPHGSSGVEDSGVISIFLISRSNCAFANYKSEEHLNRAICRFTGHKLRPHDRRCPRLVCRARRVEDDLRAGVGVQRGRGVHTRHVENMLEKDSATLITGEEPASSEGHWSGLSKTSNSPLAPSAPKGEEAAKTHTAEESKMKVPTQSSSASSHASTSSSLLARYFPKRYFILKSLTQEDLDLSTKRGVWATQRHNEVILDQAFRTSKDVILVFSVNKSGEFYGYARMASSIFDGNHNVSWAPRAGPSSDTTSPSSSHASTLGLVEQFEDPSSQGQMDTSAFDPKVTSPVTLSLDSSSRVKSAQERRSALPPLDQNIKDVVGPHPPPQSGSGSRWSRIFDPSRSSTLRPQSGRCPGLRATRSEEGGPPDQSGNHVLRLLPATKEAYFEDPPVRTGVHSTAMPGHGERQERDASWGETFKIEWLCTDRVQFHRTRHLRNPWNHSREIKVSRDGTELEPGVGQQLVDSWSTLAVEPAGGSDARHTTNSTGRRSGNVPKPNPSAEPKRIKGKSS